MESVRTKLDVNPTKGAGDFVLGSSIGSIILIIKSKFPVCPYKLSFAQEKPLDADILLELPDLGMKLIFDPLCQRLTTIELNDLTKLELYYQSKAFRYFTLISSEKVSPTFTLIYNLFGPIYPGTLDEHQIYTLTYPGISFLFPIPESFTLQKGELPFLLKDNTVPILKSVLVYQNKGEPIIGSDPDYFEPVIIHPRSIEFTIRQSIIKLLDTPQDILCELGAPQGQMQKDKDQMEIHRSEKQSDVSKPCDYIWNYFTLGLDFVFDGSLHRLLKIIVHTNQLGHHEMMKYGKCNFTFFDKGLDHKSTWKQIKQKLDHSFGQPVIYNKDENPFGPTSYYGYDGTLFEILKNDYIASVTLFLNE